MTCTGDWDVTQTAGSAVDATGLVFTVTYRDGTTKVVTSDVTVSPENWEAEAGDQTATFSYTEDGETITVQKTASVQPSSP